MCTDCFQKEYVSFLTEREWLDFDLNLSKKLVDGKMIYINSKSDGQRPIDDYEYYYECFSCHQKWKLKVPEFSLRGHFLTF